MERWYLKYIEEGSSTNIFLKFNLLSGKYNIELNNQKKFDLEDRLVNFEVLVLNMTEKLPHNYGAIHLSKQISRSSTAPALFPSYSTQLIKTRYSSNLLSEFFISKTSKLSSP